MKIYVYSVAYHPGGLQLASGGGYGDNAVCLWDWRAGACKQTLPGHEEDVKSVAYRPDGAQLASGSWDKTVLEQRKEDVKRLQQQKQQNAPSPFDAPPSGF